MDDPDTKSEDNTNFEIRSFSNMNRDFLTKMTFSSSLIRNFLDSLKTKLDGENTSFPDIDIIKTMLILRSEIGILLSKIDRNFINFADKNKKNKDLINSINSFQDELQKIMSLNNKIDKIPVLLKIEKIFSINKQELNEKDIFVGIELKNHNIVPISEDSFYRMALLYNEAKPDKFKILEDVVKDYFT